LIWGGIGSVGANATEQELADEAPAGSIASLFSACSAPTGNMHLNPKNQVSIAAIILYSAG
jgi:hypothetical protein